MGLVEIQFPTDQAYDSEFSPGWNTGILELDSGAEERVSRWDVPRHRYDLAHSVRTIDNLNTIKTFYVARQGAANGFRFKDWQDFNSSSTNRGTVAFGDQDIGTGTGSLTTFQLRKKYSSGGVDVYRKITKPVSGTVLVGVNGVNQASGWTVNTTTGLVTFTTAPANGLVVTAGFEFDVPVRFEKEADEALRMTYENYEQGNMSIPIVEVLDEEAQADDFPYGGSKLLSPFIENTTITVSEARFWRLNPTVAIKRLILPKATALAGGGPYFVLRNAGAVSTDLYEQASPVTNPETTLSITLVVNDMVECWVGKDTDGTTNKWFFIQ